MSDNKHPCWVLLDPETSDLVLLSIEGDSIQEHYFDSPYGKHSLYWDLDFSEVILFAQLKELRDPGFAIEALYKYKSLGEL